MLVLSLTLDVGGTLMQNVLKLHFVLFKDPNVKAILINIFGGIVRDVLLKELLMLTKHG
jgi:succinyl-CoA synthetase beta subunit